MFIKIAADELAWWRRALMFLCWRAHVAFLWMTERSVRLHLWLGKMQRDLYAQTEVSVEVRLMIPEKTLGPIIEAEREQERKQLVPVVDPRATQSRN